MIKLDVENYCENCPEFRADVKKEYPIEVCVEGVFKEIPGDTIVRCANRARCSAIVDYLASLTKPAENNNTCVLCGKVIPEGRQLCPKCEFGAGVMSTKED